MKSTFTKLLLAAGMAALLAGCGSSGPPDLGTTSQPDPKTIPGSAASGGHNGAPAAALRNQQAAGSASATPAGG